MTGKELQARRDAMADAAQFWRGLLFTQGYREFDRRTKIGKLRVALQYAIGAIRHSTPDVAASFAREAAHAAFRAVPGLRG